MGGGRKIPSIHWLSSLAQSVSSKVSERLCLKEKIRWRVMEEASADAWLPLLSAHTYTCMRLPEHTQTCIHAYSTDTERDTGRKQFQKTSPVLQLGGGISGKEQGAVHLSAEAALTVFSCLQILFFLASLTSC